MFLASITEICLCAVFPPTHSLFISPHAGHVEQLARIGDLLLISAYLLLALNWIASEMFLENETSSK